MVRNIEGSYEVPDFEAAKAAPGVTNDPPNVVSDRPGPGRLPVRPPSPASTLGRYQLLRRLAVGGMAEIYLASLSDSNAVKRQVAIKKIRPHLSAEPSFVEMFLQEAKLAVQLNHPNLVQITDFGEVDGVYYIAMEYVQGQDMSKIVPRAERRGIRFPIEYAMYIGAKCLEGLRYAHRLADQRGNPMSIVHRDVTPENIIVSWSGEVKILDFGIAKAASHTHQTKAGEIKGKLAYMSPEQARGWSLDARSDIFTLGVVLYEWVTGYRLFTGENEMAVLRNVVDSKIYPPSYFREDVPVEVENILMRALEKDRDHRYAEAEAMLSDIQAWLQAGAFFPSASHLSTFMCQLFDEEERSQEPGVLTRSVLSADPSASTTRELAVELSLAQWQRLDRAASRMDLSVEDVASRLLSAHAALLADDA